MKYIILILTAILTSIHSFGQNELELYKVLYKTADSLIAIGEISSIDTTSIFAKAKNLDNKHPVEYFKVSSKYLEKFKFNEAAFFYFLGSMRYRYYNSANPKYKPGDDGALYSSFKYVVGEPLKMFLQTDIDNMISIIRLAIYYYSGNDYDFFSKDKNKEKYNLQIKLYNDLAQKFETQKETYIEEWTKNRKEWEEQMDKMIEEKKHQSQKIGR